MNTIANIRRLFKEAKRIKKQMTTVEQLKELAGPNPGRDFSREWYELETGLKVVLREILAHNFVLLSKPQLIEFLVLCSSHRPTDPVWILVDLANRWEEMNA